MSEREIQKTGLGSDAYCVSNLCFTSSELTKAFFLGIKNVFRQKPQILDFDKFFIGILCDSRPVIAIDSKPPPKILSNSSDPVLIRKIAFSVSKIELFSEIH